VRTGLSGPDVRCYLYSGSRARGMANFFAELKRRHIYRVGAAYVVVAWAMTQVTRAIGKVASECFSRVGLPLVSSMQPPVLCYSRAFIILLRESSGCPSGLRKRRRITSHRTSITKGLGKDAS